MGFHTFDSPYDWSRISSYKKTAAAAPGGMINLSVGSPVDPVPANVQQALAEHAEAPDSHGYPKATGSEALRRAVPEWFKSVRGVDFEAIDADFVPTVGSKEGVALMASLLHLGEGDVVVQPAISYPTYEIGTQIAGASTHKVADIADVDSWRSVPGVKAVWVNSPCNPTGETLSAAQLKGIVAAAREIGAVVLSDECYALLTWGSDDENDGGAKAGNRSATLNGKLQSFASDVDVRRGTGDTLPASEACGLSGPLVGAGFAPASCMLQPDVCGGSARGILVLYSLSKQSNMAGYRTALVAGDKDLIAEMAVYRKQIGEIIPGPVQAAMAVAMGDTDDVVTQHARYERRLHALVAALRGHGYDAHMPQGALYVWVKARSGDCWTDLADLARLGIIASPGEFYGDPTSLRFSATATDSTIAEVSARLAA
ncbi:aminotransferase class I/II-fold pyridoxal phosphate-dependent enzyme [Bifidobacterium sp. ESL0790]|uniref:aminotransferase class I/II-fold pyridoxal phosphate-dependent enzyme n=1 Tax=Bifidobacterium sp. ESL0790 TaxID=2983233 RepID=UPI0023F6E9B9|nr:aminotransferase class I/II-fold pyridoxal phosphate-dependent enzyme [Bifidobacterium sp. ESL0790]WEV72167.1 aminotransferase class I/II-fold pyridoxal phosphate-dependent enzyme [Bifidobacterium sp. ESL0790]